MLKLETRAELDALYTGLMKESLTLEYKSSGAVDKAQPKKEEMAKDALAFANAEGGQIVYGMKEKSNLPDGFDSGIDPLQFPGIWFEQVIQQNASPQIEGLQIKEIPLDAQASRVAVVVTIPPAQSQPPTRPRMVVTTGGTISAIRSWRISNPRYDAACYDGRAVRAPSFAKGMTVPIEYAHGSEISKPITLDAFIGNRSRQPAYHTLIELGIETDIPNSVARRLHAYWRAHRPGRICPKLVITPKQHHPTCPFLRKFEFVLSKSNNAWVCLSLLSAEHRFRVTTIVQTPGFASTEHWTIQQQRSALKLLEPGHALAR